MIFILSEQMEKFTKLKLKLMVITIMKEIKEDLNQKELLTAQNNMLLRIIQKTNSITIKVVVNGGI